jgi:hypothetical protein
MNDNLTGQLGTKLSEMEESLKKEQEEHSTTRRLYARSIQERVELKATLRGAPPISAKTLRGLLLYTYADAQTHEGLTETEKGLITREEFETLMKWALEKKEA